MTHLFEQNHGARIVRQASPGAVSLKPQASSFKHFDLLLLLAFSLQLAVTAPF
ncbi:hypothetical protein [Pseudomonas syringae]|uniref:hypothetical protein n=1 Tax=Pseudomonas syringae TaxID=317 RepID=UPI0013C34889|nr:hypothetical protein [Pseudomonas syringae]